MIIVSYSLIQQIKTNATVLTLVFTNFLWLLLGFESESLIYKDLNSKKSFLLILWKKIT